LDKYTQKVTLWMHYMQVWDLKAFFTYDI